MWDFVFLAGLVLAISGIALIYPPAALIIGGCAISGLAYVMGRPEAPPNEPTQQTQIND